MRGSDPAGCVDAARGEAASGAFGTDALTWIRPPPGVARSATSGRPGPGTTTAGEQLRVRGCDLLDLAPDGQVRRKDSYWKIVE